eukprot:COSAG01_NODE_5303_length_4350_cov_14.343213_4_plen_78_part_00
MASPAVDTWPLRPFRAAHSLFCFFNTQKLKKSGDLITRIPTGRHPRILGLDWKFVDTTAPTRTLCDTKLLCHRALVA